MVKRYEFEVKMTCGGCSGAIERALKKAEGIENFTVNLGNQSVVVTPKTASYDEVYQKIAKTGKQILSGKEVEASGA